MSKEAFKIIKEHGSYYLTEEGMYIRMYGGSREPSLLPKYAIDYVLHKEVVKQIYIDVLEASCSNITRQHILPYLFG